MKFKLYSDPQTYEPGTAVLQMIDWNDWFKFETKFSLIICTANGEKVHAGIVKIAIKDQPSGKTPLPKEFSELDDQFFSLGQNENYYETICALGPELSKEIFLSMRDCAFDLDIFKGVQNQNVMTESLLRSIDIERVENRFHRLAHGDTSLTSFDFKYSLPPSMPGLEPLDLDFSVSPNSNPPSNIHVLIGRNGVGKTRLFRLMTHALRGDGEEIAGKFSSQQTGGSATFANVVSVAFSAFDPFDPLPDGGIGDGNMTYSYVGLRRAPSVDNSVTSAGANIAATRPPKTPEEMTKEFVESLQKCSTGLRADRWREAIATLTTDELFRDAEIDGLLVDGIELDSEKAFQTFKLLSSGHKIVLLTITRLVELVDEKTLVLIDEPEAHLHPPLLSAFISALSYLLVKRNGVSIIATHSPVVLQEVPKKCVWFISRSGAVTSACRPDSETFGENVSVLTRDAFGLEVTHSGFHKLLIEKSKTVNTYEELLLAFDGELGAEAKALARSLILSKV